MQRLLEILRQLRAPDGCPWDREQTHQSLRKYLLEEAAEAVDAITTNDPAQMADELGDVLLQIAFHAVIAEEAGTFGYAEIEDAIVQKLIRRHPHVFGDTEVSGAAEVVSNWQAIKANERAARGEQGEPPPASRVPRSLPALMRASQIGKVLGWEAAPLADEPGSDSRSIGRFLLAVAQHARARGVDPELALREAIDEAVAASTNDEARGEA